MKKDNMCILRGIATALAAGILVGFFGGKMMKGRHKKTKKRTDRAVHAVGDLLENVHYMFK